MFHSSTRPPRPSSSNPEVYGGVRRSMESMLATKNQREFELESTRKELAAIKLKLEHSQRTLLQEKRQNAQLRGALDKSASNQQLFISLFEECATHLSKCSGLINEAQRFGDQRNSFVLEGERMLEICSTFDSRALSCTSALLQTLKAQVVSQEKTRGALRGAFELLQRHQRDTDTRQRRVQLERSSLLRCDLLSAARESAAVKVFHDVQDLEARNLNHSLTNWIACLRNTMVREHVLRRCQENKTSCKKMPLMRFPDDGTTPHACGDTKKNDTWECTPSDVPHLHDDIFLMQNEYDHVTRVDMSSGKERKEMYNAVKVTAEALRKLQAIKNREYLQKRRTKVEKRKEIVADRTRQQDRAANDENPRQRKKKKVNDEKGTLDVFASIMSSCDS